MNDHKHTDSNDSRKAYNDDINDSRKAYVGGHKDRTEMCALGLRGLLMSSLRYTSLHYLLVLCVMALGKSYFNNCILCFYSNCLCKGIDNEGSECQRQQTYVSECFFFVSRILVALCSF